MKKTSIRGPKTNIWRIVALCNTIVIAGLLYELIKLYSLYADLSNSLVFASTTMSIVQQLCGR